MRGQREITLGRIARSGRISRPRGSPWGRHGVAKQHQVVTSYKFKMASIIHQKGPPKQQVRQTSKYGRIFMNLTST